MKLVNTPECLRSSEEPNVDLVAIANQFGATVNVRELGDGNINDTFLAFPDSQSPALNSARSATPFVLQRINTQVFQQPELVMQNMQAVTRHLHDRLQSDTRPQLLADRRWEVPHVLPTINGDNHWIAKDGSFWRAIAFVPNANCADALDNCDCAREVGTALGIFHALLSDLPATTLVDTLPGFHVTPQYLQTYDRVADTAVPTRSPEVEFCRRFIEARRANADVLEAAKARGHLPTRPMHGDPKANNILTDAVTGRAVSVIDLDTVKPGLIHYDIGDCLRSGCNPLGEETDCWESVCFEPELGVSLLQGYLFVARSFLTVNDREYIYDAIRLIAFELGLRFFTDYLAGNTYFKVKYPEHNLARSLVQFKLAESIEAQEPTIRAIVRDLS
ncbi:putative homoserine kinase type II [Rubidibacter lacunae KORDI 51-2]|uniref:Putative homoserine kinase type II n=1 Tax=Rubidibacter lacunae KORDI 51-2 TaxID=582515 RepID=U5DN73_9CHRO|nr:aminoglycoside phosphotransferase family protein [Rubidibacter lacunae]ERN41135.1 putative homoserine kinase type II [Rubidibacter lacunae KORDI 51-2]